MFYPRDRYVALLGTMLTLYVGQAVPAGAQYKAMLLNVLLLFVLVAGLGTLGRRRRRLGAAIIVALLAAGSGWASVITEQAWLAVFSTSCYLTFFMLMAHAVLGAALEHEVVTRDTLAAALCVYVLMALCFAFTFALLQHVTPGAFNLSNVEATTNPWQATCELLYFSFVTLTTLGYGDITPQSTMARTLATLEALGGQLFLGVLVARLIGLQLTEAKGRHREDAPSSD